MPRTSTPRWGLVLASILAGCGGGGDVAAIDRTPTDSPATSGAPAPAEPGDATSTTATPAEPEERAEPADEVRVVPLAFADGEVTTGGERISVGSGERVRLEVTSDVAEEVHVHGYDLEVPVPPGETTAIDLVGDLPGVWEVELHESGALLAELEVAG